MTKPEESNRTVIERREVIVWEVQHRLNEASEARAAADREAQAAEARSTSAGVAAQGVDDLAAAEKAQAAVDWVRRVRRNGSAWQVLPEPSCDELRPNLSNDQVSVFKQMGLI